MKVCITSKKHPVTGKGYFIQRLIPFLEKNGCKVIGDPSEKADIDLQVGKLHYKPNAKRSILRLGPAHINRAQNYKKLNKPKRESMKKVDGIIYQSKYSKAVCHKFLTKPKRKEVVIHNGADFDFFLTQKKLPMVHEYNFCAVTRKWIHQKRLKGIIQGFNLANIPDSCLHIAGQVLGSEEKHKSKNINFVGSLDTRQLARLYRSCTAMIHMVYLDACPNSVVESIASGCPVIYSNQGGTRELVRSFGLPVQDKGYNFQPINLERPPKVNLSALAVAIKESIDTDFRHGDTHKLHIDTIAKQYIEFFEEVLR